MNVCRSVKNLVVSTVLGCVVACRVHGSQAPQTEQPFTVHRLAADPAGGGDPAISPDGTRLVISSLRGGQSDLWMLDLRTDRWTQLTDDPAEDSEAQWSPDGTRLVFTSNRGRNSKDIWLLQVSTRALTQLTDTPHDDDYPNWAPDGDSIVCTGGPWTRQHFYSVDLRTRNLTQLTKSEGTGGACSVERDNRSYVCHRYDSGDGDLLRLDAQSGTTEPLTKGRAWDYKPTVAPGGHWIAFSRATEGPAHIELMSATGGAPVALTHGPFNDRWPTWTAGGERLVFHRRVEEGVGVRLVERATGDVTELVGAAEHPLLASMHPDGSTLAYCAIDGDRRVVRVRDLAAATMKQFADEACFPKWSPGGEALAFAIKRRDRWELATSRPDGSDVRVWTTAAERLRGLDGPLAWAPDGRSIVFKADTGPFESDIFKLDMSTGSVTAITRDASFDEAPSWSADGSAVLFMSTRGGNWTWGLYRMRLSDSTLTTLAGPDYQEKNFVQESATGDLLWSAFDDRHRQWLVESRVGQQQAVLSAADSGARWATFARGGTAILYTQVEERAEYWAIDHPVGVGSPARGALLPPGAP